jgi:hypothetical protein
VRLQRHRHGPEREEGRAASVDEQSRRGFLCECASEIVDRSLQTDLQISTFGLQPSCSFAFLMSGRRRCGSSTGRGSFMIFDDDAVSSITSSASSIIVNSAGLPILTGPSSALEEFISLTMPSTRSDP